MEFQSTIRERRMEKHMSQGDLAKLIKVKQTQLSRYERGDAFPSLAVLYKLEVVLDCRLKDLYSEI